MSKLTRYATNAGIGTVLLLETIFGTSCTANLSVGAKGYKGDKNYRAPIALSVGMDAHDTSVNSEKGDASTPYSPYKRNIMFWNGGSWNGTYYRPGYYTFGSGCLYPYISPNNTMNGPDRSFRVYP